MLAALPQAALAGGVSLFGGLLDNRAQKKAANDAFNYQATLNTAAFYQQQGLNREAQQHQRELNSDAFWQQRALDQDAFTRQNHFFDRGVEAQRQLSADAYVQGQGYLATQNQQVNLLNDRVDAYNRDILANHSTNSTTNSESYWSDTSVVNSIDFTRMVTDAEAAGFNPLTVLRAGAWAGFSTSNTSVRGGSSVTTTSRAARDTMGYFAPSQAPSAYTPQAQHVTWAQTQINHPGQAMAGNAPSPGQAPQAQPSNAFSNAANAAIAAWNSYDPYAADRQKLELGLAKAQIDNLTSDTAMNNRRTFAVPTWTGVPGVQSAGGVRGAVNSALGGVATPTPGEVKVTNPTNTMLVDPSQRDYSAYEERYGEVLGNLAGVGIAIKDAIHNYTNNSKAPPKAKAVGSFLNDTYNALVNSWGKGNDGAVSNLF